MRTAALLLGLLLAPALALPVAEGDHVYSHRFVFEGRLVGANGFPLPGREVTFFAEGDDFVEPCRDQPHEPVTNEWGDFLFCFHKHELKPSVVTGVRVGNVTERKIMDTAFRRTIVLLRDHEQDGIAPPEWDTTYRIAGKVWQPGAMRLDNVSVYGYAVPDVEVNVTLVTPNGTDTYLVRTDAYGDFDAVIRLVENVSASDVQVRTEALGQALRFPLSPVFHRSTVGLRVPPSPQIRIVTDGPPPPGPVDTQTLGNPGTSTPPLGGAVLAVALLALVVLAVLWARHR